MTAWDRANIDPRALNLNKLGRHPLEDVSRQVSKLWLFGFLKEDFLYIYMTHGLLFEQT
jgi:hypothetical protein